jgi:hypothetical protein
MTVKTITQPTSGQTFKLGRRRPIARGPRLSLNRYLSRSLPTPPAEWDYTAPAASVLKNLYLNDQLGDCVIAGMAHLEGVFTASGTGTPVAFTDDQITAMYGAIGGYVPGDPSTDNGCDEVTALNYWEQTGFEGHKISGYLAVNAADKDECAVAAWLFENMFFGVNLPDRWINPMPASDGFTWGVAGAADPQNGHCFISAKGNLSEGVSIDTWGMSGLVTWAAVAAYASHGAGGDLFVVLTPEIVSRAIGRAPNGFAWGQLLADFAAIGGKVAA